METRNHGDRARPVAEPYAKPCGPRDDPRHPGRGWLGTDGQSLQALPRLRITRSRPRSLPSVTNCSNGLERTAAKLASLNAQGGQDNIPALVRAWDAAAAKGGVVIWLHGPQASSIDYGRRIAPTLGAQAEGPPL